MPALTAADLAAPRITSGLTGYPGLAVFPRKPPTFPGSAPPLAVYGLSIRLEAPSSRKRNGDFTAHRLVAHWIAVFGGLAPWVRLWHATRARRPIAAMEKSTSPAHARTATGLALAPPFSSRGAPDALRAVSATLKPWAWAHGEVLPLPRARWTCISFRAHIGWFRREHAFWKPPGGVVPRRMQAVPLQPAADRVDR